MTFEEEQKINLEKWTYLYHRMPNLLDDTAAVGNTDADNKVEKLFLEPKNFGFPVVSHWEI